MDLFSDFLNEAPTTVVEPPAPVQSIQLVQTGRMNPWARQGRTLMKEACSDPDVAIQQAGLNWTVEKVAMRCADTLDTVPEFAAIRRSDNHGILGVVGKDYEAFQNNQMFQVFKDLAAVDGGLPFTIETAGSFQKGKIVWALAHLPDLGITIGDDVSKTYLLVSNGHSGNRTLIIAPTTIRVVCQNTLKLADAQARTLGNGFILRHTPGIHEAVEAAKATFAATIQSHRVTKMAWEHLARKPLTARLQNEFMGLVFGQPGPDESERARTMRKTREDRIASILASPTSQVKGTKDSVLALLHSLVEFVDHFRITRSAEEGNSDESRLYSATYGSGANLKAQAWAAALELAA